MSLSLEALDVFGQLLSDVKLDAMDPQLEAKAAMLARVRVELAAAIEDAKRADEAEA